MGIPGKFSHGRFENPMQARLRRLYLDDVMSNSKEMLFFTKEKDKGNKPNANAPNGLSPLAYKSVNIPLSNNDAKNLNNVESGGKKIDDEDNDSNDRFDMSHCCQNFAERTFT